jgi:hypothetical protein
MSWPFILVVSTVISSVSCSVFNGSFCRSRPSFSGLRLTRLYYNFHTRSL